MLKSILFIAQSENDDAFDRWFADNPRGTGLVYLAIGLTLLGFGLFALYKGVALDKRGNEYGGWQGRFIAIVQTIAGIAGCSFGIYKIMAV